MNFRVDYEGNADHPQQITHTDDEPIDDYDTCEHAVFETFNEARASLTEYIETVIIDLQHTITYLALITEEEVS